MMTAAPAIPRLGIAEYVWWNEALHGVSFGVFFFQAEDGIRDWSVTGVQTCALPISHGWSALARRLRSASARSAREASGGELYASRRLWPHADRVAGAAPEVGAEQRCHQIGRASCRERG